jgi:hypothetical protein
MPIATPNTRIIHMPIATGYPVTDATVPRNDPSRHFRCKSVLLYWTGDYPAQSKVSCHHEKVCHWCEYKSGAAPEINRRKWVDYRRWLPEGHRYRTDRSFGDPEPRPPPPPRTHDGYLRDGNANVAYTGFKKYAPYKKTGVKEVHFDHIWCLFR